MRHLPILAVCAVLVLSVTPARAAEAFVPTIPAGYSPQVVLHVDYGKTPETVGLRWAGGGNEYVDAASVTNMRVVGDRFYFIDATVDRIKQFRSPGTLVWASQVFPNLGYFAVAPDGKVYVVWGTRLDTLSYLDRDGKLLWTKQGREVFPEARKAALGLAPYPPVWGPLEWTGRGLTAHATGKDQRGRRGEFTVVFDADGIAKELLPGIMVGPDGTVYDLQLNDGAGKRLASPIVTRWEVPGKLGRQIHLNLQAEKGKYLVGLDPGTGSFQMRIDPRGGFLIEQHVWLPARVQVTKQMDTRVAEVLWRLDSEGNPTEQWRFPASTFAGRASEIVVGNDGNVYHLTFGETGIDVVKYSRDDR